jgi:hypothetical protein
MWPLALPELTEDVSATKPNLWAFHFTLMSVNLAEKASADKLVQEHQAGQTQTRSWL